MTDRRISKFDAVVFNALVAVVIPVIDDADRIAMHLHILGDALPHASVEHPFVQPLVAAGYDLIECARFKAVKRIGGHEPMSWANACWQARSAIARFAEWRLGETLEAIEIAQLADRVVA